MADSSSLIAAIDKLVEEKTFNLDAVLAINELRKKAEALEQEKAELEREVEAKRKQIVKGDDTVTKLTTRVVEKDKEIEVFKAREQAAFDSIKTAAVAAGVAEAYKDALKTVFAPAVFREQVYKSVPVFQSYQGGGGNMTTQTESGTTERREDTK